MSEYPVQFSEEESTLEAVGELKQALIRIQEPLSWHSSDGKYLYRAHPIDTPLEAEDYVNLGQTSVGAYYERCNAWQLIRIGEPDIDGEVAIDHYILLAGQPLSVTTHVLLGDREIADQLSEINKEVDLQYSLGLNEATVWDYAQIDNALWDLKPVARAKLEAWMDAQRNLTEDEMRWKRLQKYAWLREPEVDKIGGSQWWAFSEGSLLHAVKANSPDEAALLLEDHHGTGSLFPFFFVDRYPDDIKIVFDEQFVDRHVVRLIPFSNIEWPTDPDNMTPEQEAAFDALGHSGDSEES